MTQGYILYGTLLIFCLGDIPVQAVPRYRTGRAFYTCSAGILG